MVIRGIETITIDRRSNDIYSASFYVQSDSRPQLRHHVTIWFSYSIEEDFFGRVIDVMIIPKKYSCTCEHYTFRASKCKHIDKAINMLKEIIINNGGELDS